MCRYYNVHRSSYRRRRFNILKKYIYVNIFILKDTSTEKTSIFVTSTQNADRGSERDCLIFRDANLNRMLFFYFTILHSCYLHQISIFLNIAALLMLRHTVTSTIVLPTK